MPNMPLRPIHPNQVPRPVWGHGVTSGSVAQPLHPALARSLQDRPKVHSFCTSSPAGRPWPRSLPAAPLSGSDSLAPLRSSAWRQLQPCRASCRDLPRAGLTWGTGSFVHSRQGRQHAPLAFCAAEHTPGTGVRTPCPAPRT